MTYSFKTGVWKSIKNVAIVMGVPAVILAADNITNLIPNEWNIWTMPSIGLVSYLVKNYVENK